MIDDEPDVQTAHHVVIIGAGMAGIKAAHILAKRGLRITIVEGNDYIGGRMRSFEMQGVKLEDGATWIQSLAAEKENPIWTLSKKIGLEHRESDFDNLCAVMGDGSGDVTAAFKQ